MAVADKGKYQLKITLVGMDSLTVAVSLATQQNVPLPELMMTAASHQLQQVNVVSSRPLIEQKIDRTVVNVDRLLTASGMSALDVLQKSPGIQVDPNSGISLKGKTSVIVMIDDRPTYLSGEALTNYLKSLPASTLDQLEIMTNPPAKYDAAGNAGVIAAGIKSSYTTTDNVADYISTTTGGLLLPDYDLSNHFLYRESINAGYVNFNKDYKRLSVQAGLRLENTQSDGHQLGNAERPDSAFNRHYLDLFPTVYLSYKLDTAGNNVLGLSYGRRIDRPFYRDLNPFTTTADRYTYYVGNPFLNPSFSNKVELSLSLLDHVTIALDWNRVNGDIDEVIQIRNGIFYSQQQNVGITTVRGVSLDAGFDPAKWLSVHFYGELMNDAYQTVLPSGSLDKNGTYFYLDPMLQFKFSPTWIAQLDGFYRNRVVATQFYLLRRGEANIGISKKVSDNLSLRLAVNDFTHAYVNSGIITNLGTNEASYRNISDSRVAIFSLSYRFGKAISNLKQHEANGAQEEENRVKQ